MNTKEDLPEQENTAVVTDVLGLGAIAKSQAGREIGKAIGKAIGAVADPARTLLLGLAKNKVDTDRITKIAEAEAKARQIQVASDELIERMKERVVAGEIRQQKH